MTDGTPVADGIFPLERSRRKDGIDHGRGLVDVGKHDDHIFRSQCRSDFETFSIVFRFASAVKFCQQLIVEYFQFPP